MREKRPSLAVWLLALLVVLSPWVMAAGGWTDIVTNFMATRLDPNMRGSAATDQYVPTYDHPSRSYILKAGGGGGGITTINGGTGIQAVTVGATTTVTNTGVRTLTAGTNVTIGGTVTDPIVNASVSGSGINGTVNGAGSTALTTVNVTGTLLGAKSSISGSTLNVSLDQIVNADVATGAAIAYSKLALTNSVLVADIAAAAKTGSGRVVLDTGATIGTPTLVFGSDADGDIYERISGAGGRLAKGGNSTVLSVSSGGALGYTQITNAMIVPAAGISYSKLTLTGAVVDGDLATIYIKANGTRALTANWDPGAFQIFRSGTGTGTDYSTSNEYASTGNFDTITARTTNGNLTIGPNGTGTLVNIPVGKTLATDNVTSSAGGALAISSGGGNTAITLTPSGTGAVAFNNGRSSFVDAAASPTSAGQFYRNGPDLQFYNTASRNVIDDEFHAAVQTFTSSSGTCTPTANTVFCMIECIGSGGGGGGVVGAVADSNGGGGGGAGGYSRSMISAPSAVSYTIGGGGAGGSAGANNGSNGGDAVYGSSVVVAKGGSGGLYASNAVQVGNGGLGGVITGAVGNFTSVGAPGGPGTYATIATVAAIGGYGGAGVYSGGGKPTVIIASSSAGGGGSPYGSGGAGAAAAGVLANAAGGAGSIGIIIETDYVRR